MHLSIEHISTYRFEVPVRFVIQSHRLEASRFEGQTVLDWKVSVEDAIFGQFFTDPAGDKVRTMTVNGPLTELSVHVKGTVETVDKGGVLAGHFERVPPLAYLRETDPTRADAAITELAEAARGAGNPLDQAHALAASIAEAIRYSPGSTHENTTAAQALEQGEGVCQDHAHALIAAARPLDLPARYVSGYLQATEDGAPNEAGHAWAEIYVKDLGWVGFDPANKCCPDERYVRLGSGLDAVHAAPIRGISHGVSMGDLSVKVAVEAMQQ